MSYLDGPDLTIEPIINGIIRIIQKNLAAKTGLIADAHAGDSVIYVDNTARFRRKESIILLDKNSQIKPDTNCYTGIEWHTIDGPVRPQSIFLTDTNKLILKEPLKRDFLVSDNSQIWKTVGRTILREKDVLYGDRTVIPFDHVAITVEPDTESNEWVALQGMSNQEYRASIMVYVKYGTAGLLEENAMLICNAYAAAMTRLFMENIHLDVDIDEVALRKDLYAGHQSIFVGPEYAHDWPPDACDRYELQDNFHCQFYQSVVNPVIESSSSSSSSSLSFEQSSASSDSESSESSLSSSSVSSESSSSSSSSLSSLSESETSSSSASSLSSQSSDSSWNESSSSSQSDEELFEIHLANPSLYHFKVSDKAVLRRRIRYLYDSRASDATYGVAQKGSVFLKAAKIAWFGKETQTFTFPQIGMGGKVY